MVVIKVYYDSSIMKSYLDYIDFHYDLDIHMHYVSYYMNYFYNVLLII